MELPTREDSAPGGPEHLDTVGVTGSNPVSRTCRLVLAASKDIHVLRDATRGGVTSVLTEIAQTARVGMLLDEARIPISEEVKGACEILGLAPLYVANEGKLLALVAAQETDRVLAAMKSHPLCREAAVIGEVTNDHPSFIMMKRASAERA